MPQASKAPVHKIRAGRIIASIWANEKEDVGKWFSVTFSRGYHDKYGEVHYAKTYGRDDLLVLAELANQAWSWIVEQDADELEENMSQVQP